MTMVFDTCNFMGHGNTTGKKTCLDLCRDGIRTLGHTNYPERFSSVMDNIRHGKLDLINGH